MPIFEYRCEKCGTKFEKLVRRTAEASELGCPSCGGTDLKQEFSTFAAHANGRAADVPMCPSGGPCNPSRCGMHSN
jgi:putative FmdB family regulatory protein